MNVRPSFGIWGRLFYVFLFVEFLWGRPVSELGRPVARVGSGVRQIGR